MTTPDGAATTTTRIDVTGANCPWCFNDVMDRLRADPAVVSVRGSIATHLLVVEHGGADDERLLALVQRNLHVDARGSSEHVMAAVDPSVTELPGPHCEAPNEPGRAVR